MIRQLNKVNSASKIEEPQIALPTSPANKFKRTNKKVEVEETNATSERTESIISQDTNMDKGHALTRTNRVDKKSESKTSPQSSQIEDPFLARTNNKFKTSPDAFQPQNFMKKPPLTLNTQSILTQQTTVKPMRSPRGNTSRLIPPNPIEQQKEAKSIEVKQLPLKKSVVAAYLLDQLYRSILKNCLQTLRQNKQTLKIKTERQASILVYSMSEFSKRFQKMLKLQAINRCKLISAKKSKENYSIENQFSKLSHQKIIENLPNILNLLYRSKIRGVFEIFKKNRIRKQFISKCYPTLFDYYEKRKLNSAYNLFITSSKTGNARKNVLLNQIEASYKFCTTLSLFQSFKQIKLFSTSNKKVETREQIITPRLNHVKSLSKIPVDTKKQKIGQQMQKVEKDLSEIQQRITQRRREKDTESKKLKKQIEDLKEKNAQIKHEVNEKKSINQSLKVQAQQFEGQNVQINIEQDGKEGAELTLLQQLYCKISRMPEEDLPNSIQKIMANHKIQIKEGNTLVQQWLLIQQKLSLQKQIDCYQNQILGQRKTGSSNIAKMMREQSQIVVQMIKNYVKQRYLWGQVERFVANVL